MAVSTSQITFLKQSDKSDAVLLGLLAMLEPGKEICPAGIVNLAYLLDEYSYQHDGVTLTGFDYVRSDDGANTANDEVEQRLDALVRKKLIHCTKKQASPDNGIDRYKIHGQVNLAEIPLSADDWALIHSVIREYGSMSREDIVKASLRTLPMNSGVRHGRLQFQANPEIEAFKQSIRDDADFIEECMDALAEGAEGIDVEELRGAAVAKQINS